MASEPIALRSVSHKYSCHGMQGCKRYYMTWAHTHCAQSFLCIRYPMQDVAQVISNTCRSTCRIQKPWTRAIQRERETVEWQWKDQILTHDHNSKPADPFLPIVVYACKYALTRTNIEARENAHYLLNRWLVTSTFSARFAHIHTHTHAPICTCTRTRTQHKAYLPSAHTRPGSSSIAARSSSNRVAECIP